MDHRGRSTLSYGQADLPLAIRMSHCAIGFVVHRRTDKPMCHWPSDRRTLSYGQTDVPLAIGSLYVVVRTNQCAIGHRIVILWYE